MTELEKIGAQLELFVGKGSLSIQEIFDYFSLVSKALSLRVRALEVEINELKRK